MACTHIVKQGENLFSIARKYKLGKWQDIYNHSKNTTFRTKRPDPDIIMPKDKLYVPDPEQKKVTVSTGKTHRFVLKSPKQILKIKLELHEDLSTDKSCAILTIGSQATESKVQQDGMIEMDIYNSEASEGQLDIYLDKDSEQPDYTYRLQLSHLDPVNETTGVQARLNGLGFKCGKVDGVTGQLTEQAVRDFQTEHELKSDGIAGPLTKDALSRAYGC